MLDEKPNPPTQPIPPILPEVVPKLAWGLTLRYSEEHEARGRADEIRDRLEEVKRTVYDEVAKNVRKKEDRLYIDNVRAAIDSCERNLLVILRGRNKNFDETDKIMNTQLDNIRSSSRVMLEFHSGLPRLFAIGEGAAGTVLVGWILSWFKIVIPPEVLFAAATIFAGLSYGLYQLWLSPRNSKRALKVIIENDYRRNLYYDQYVKRSRASLKALFDQTLNIYERVYGVKYDPKYDCEDERIEVVKVAMGREALPSMFCPKVHEHHHKKIITPDVWSTCETAEGYKECPFYKS